MMSIFSDMIEEIMEVSWTTSSSIGKHLITALRI
jgi:hypothetical protein